MAISRIWLIKEVKTRIMIKGFDWKKHFDGKEYSMDGALEDFIELNK